MILITLIIEVRPRLAVDGVAEIEDLVQRAADVVI